MIKSISFLLFFFVDFFYVTQSCDGNHGVVEQDWEFRNIQQSDVYDPYRYVNIPYLIPYYYPTSSSIQTSGKTAIDSFYCYLIIYVNF